MIDVAASRRSLALCFFAALCEGFDVQAAGVAAAGLAAELRPSPSELGVFFSASGAGLLLGALLGGRLADRVSRKHILVASLAAFGACSVATSFAASLSALIVARFATGLGLGAAMPNLIVLVAAAAAPERRTTAITAVYVGMPFGAAIAGAIGLALASTSWRVVFRIGGLAPLVLAPVLAVALRAPAREAATTLPIRHAMFGERRWARTLLIWTAFFLVVLTLHLLINWLPILMRGRGMSKDEAAWAQIGFNAGGAAMTLWFARLLESRWRTASLVAVAVALPGVLLAIAVSPEEPALSFTLAAVLGASVLAQQVIAFAVANGAYPIASRGLGVGAAVAAGRVGSLVGPLVVASLLTAGRTSSEVLLGLLPIGVACSASVAIAAWRRDV